MWTGWTWFAVACLVLFLVFALGGLLVVMPWIQERGQQTEVINNIKNLTLLLNDRAAQEGAFPPYGGKNFLLSLVADGSVDVGRHDNLRVFFRGGSRDRVPPPEAWRRITHERLATERFPEFTDYAGRRNDEPRYRLTSRDALAAEPIIADLFEDGAIVGFTDGGAWYLDRADLGLGPDDPIVVGEGSKSALLRKLSDR